MARLGSAWASDLGQRLVTDFRAQNQMIEDTARGDPRLRAQGEERISVATNFTKVCDGSRLMLTSPPPLYRVGSERCLNDVLRR